MALAMLPKAFEVILKHLQKFEIYTLKFDILITFKVAHNFFYFSQMLYNWPLNHFQMLSKCP